MVQEVAALAILLPELEARVILRQLRQAKEIMEALARLLAPMLAPVVVVVLLLWERMEQEQQAVMVAQEQQAQFLARL